MNDEYYKKIKKFLNSKNDSICAINGPSTFCITCVITKIQDTPGGSCIARAENYVKLYENKMLKEIENI